MEGVTFVELEALLAQSDVVSLHLALNDATRNFLSRERIAAMRPGAILVNTARGALIDEAAMVDALRSGHLRHAGLDVFSLEPLPASQLAQFRQRSAPALAKLKFVGSMQLARRND